MSPAAIAGVIRSVWWIRTKVVEHRVERDRVAQVLQPLRERVGQPRETAASPSPSSGSAARRRRRRGGGRRSRGRCRRGADPRAAAGRRHRGGWRRRRWRWAGQGHGRRPAPGCAARRRRGAGGAARRSRESVGRPRSRIRAASARRGRSRRNAGDEGRGVGPFRQRVAARRRRTLPCGTQPARSACCGAREANGPRTEPRLGHDRAHLVDRRPNEYAVRQAESRSAGTEADGQ